MTYVVSMLVVLRMADGELQRAMAVDVGAGRMDWLAAVVEARRASTAEQLRRRMKVAAAQSAMNEGLMGLDWRRLAVDGEGLRAASEG